MDQVTKLDIERLAEDAVYAKLDRISQLLREASGDEAATLALCLEVVLRCVKTIKEMRALCNT